MIDANALVRKQEESGRLQTKATEPVRVDVNSPDVKNANPYPLQSVTHEYPLKG